MTPRECIEALEAEVARLKAELAERDRISVRMDGPWVRALVESAVRAGYECTGSDKSIEREVARVLKEREGEKP